MKYIKIENFENKPQVKIVSLNRPEIKNAFHPEMITEITDFFRKENSEIQSKIIILKGEGTVFSAGADLNWMKDMVNYSFEQNREDSKKLWAMFASIRDCQTPIVSIAQGAAFGGGLGLLACSDYVFAEEKMQFCFSEVKLGLAPAVISGFISGKIPDAFYRPLMLSAEVFGSHTAKQIGLVHQLYHEKIEISEVVKYFTANGTEAMKETKKLLNSLLQMQNENDKKELCTKVISERRTSQEGQERMKKFL